ncbi:MAG TPA: N-acetylglucosaminyltransferase [Clostridiales bacterium]|nr:MAG: N-acetylglucosaminyltransferase [Candidatus Margulisbacteria bacterium GWF2_35_9]HAN20703.1 N-acetylglucosaminyltransferase [Clostridiales bacterium]
MEIIQPIEKSIAFIFAICYLYQFFYTFYMLFSNEKLRTVENFKMNKFGIIIAARNEQNVIGHLIDSLHNQTYPKELLKIFIIADNCTDNTAQVCAEKGAIVYERFNDKLVGKGYALDYLFKDLIEKNDDCDGYIIFDADNLVEKNYIVEMNKTFNLGYKAITSYRNSKNYGTNWVSAGYSLWFLRESKYLNNARMRLNTSCAISGTGFCLNKQTVLDNEGWPFHLLTEDIEFSIDTVVKGGKIGYCADACVFDEQPITFAQSWKQRLRWSKGFYQVLGKYGTSLVKNIFSRHFSFSSFDMLMTIFPAIFLTVLSILLNFTKIIYGAINKDESTMFVDGITSLGQFIALGYLLLFFVGFITTITEWREINTSTFKKLIYMFTFPFFILTYIPISITAIFKKVEWVPIEHTIVTTIDQFQEK